MASTAVLEEFNIFEDFAARLSLGPPSSLMDEFDLNGGKKALCDHMVLTVPARLMLPMISCSASSRWYSRLAYWLPRSE
jgi:hypothetical protein